MQKFLGLPVSQSISAINKTQENELSSHGTGRVHNAPSQNYDSQYLKHLGEPISLLQQRTTTNPNKLHPRK